MNPIPPANVQSKRAQIAAERALERIRICRGLEAMIKDAGLSGKVKLLDVFVPVLDSLEHYTAALEINAALSDDKVGIILLKMMKAYKIMLNVLRED